MSKAIPEPVPDPVSEQEPRAAFPQPEAQLPPAPRVKPPSSSAGEPPRFASLQVQRAIKLLTQRDYEASLKLNERVLLQAGSQAPADEALFSLGLVYAHVDNPRRDCAKALAYFQRVAKEFPRSPLAEEARIWAGVLQENQNLKRVIEKTKEVDIAVDEKKREKGK